MSQREPDEYAAFIQEVRSFLAQKLTPELRAAGKRQAGIFADAQLGRVWHQILFEQGWVAPNWPVEHGGPGWDAVQRFLFQDELAKAGAPKTATFGLQLCGPVIMHYGTPEQKAYFLPRILSNEHYWCQGYSEPGAGSDLASLRTTATRQGDSYVVNGSKIWTTHAHNANWIFALVRTDASAKPHRGLSFLLIPLDSPGLTITPILSISGEHELNQVFFDNVTVPVTNRVGAENDGWGISKYLLEFERGAGAAASRIQELIRQARLLAQGPDTPGAESLWRDSPHYRRLLTELEIDVLALEFAEREVAKRLAAGEQVGSMASRLKLSASTLLQRATELNMEALGPYAAIDQRDALGSAPAADPIGPVEGATVTARYLNTRAVTIYGGTYEVQHNILARMIGL